jgi:hypothetical protein
MQGKIMLETHKIKQYFYNKQYYTKPYSIHTMTSDLCWQGKQSIASQEGNKNLTEFLD